MKFAVGEEVVVTTPKQKNWDGVTGVVKAVDPEERVFPYTLTLTADTPSGHYKSGESAVVFREDELVSASEVLKLDIAEAVRLLQKHGLAFRIYTSEDVDSILDEYAEDDKDPVDTKTFRAEIVNFIMEGQDWQKLAEKGQDDEVTLWLLVEGTRNDHPEWFVN